MVDREDRQKACELIERLANCEITNYDFDDNFPRRSRDGAIKPIFDNIWFHYSDTHTHKLVGKHALSPEARNLFERCTAFLQSDLEYEWPDCDWIALRRILLRLLGKAHAIERRFEEFKAAGDFDVWPFLRRSDWQRLEESGNSEHGTAGRQ